MSRILQRNVAKKESPPPAPVVERVPEKKKKTNAELIAEQLARQPEFDGEPIKMAQRAVSRTGLVPRIVGKGYDVGKGPQKIPSEAKQIFRPERLETVDKAEVVEARAPPKLIVVQSPPGRSVETLTSQDGDSEPPRQSTELKTRPQPTAAVRRESKLPAVPAERMIPVPALSNKANDSGSEIFVETMQLQKPICCECGQPLNLLLLQGEVPSRQMCGYCAEKKMKEVKLLQLKLLNEKKKQNLEKLTLMTAGIPSQSSSQTLDLSKQAAPQVQSQMVEFEEKLKKYDEVMSQKNQEIEEMKQRLQQQLTQASVQQQTAEQPRQQQQEPSQQPQVQQVQQPSIMQTAPAPAPTQQVQIEVQQPQVQIVQKHVVVDQSPLLVAIQQLNAGVLQSFPFIVQRKICPCCNEVTGFQIIDTNGNQVGPAELSKSLVPENTAPVPKQEEDKRFTLTKQQKKRAQRKNMQQLLDLDEKLAQLQLYDSKPSVPDLLAPTVSILSSGSIQSQRAATDDTLEDSGNELGFAFKKQ